MIQIISIIDDDLAARSAVAALMRAKGFEARAYESAEDFLVTRRKDGALAIAMWNMSEPGKRGPEKEIELRLEHARVSSVQVTHLDPDHGDVHLAVPGLIRRTRRSIRRRRRALGK